MPLDLEHKAEWSREYQRKNREHIREYKRKWRMTHPQAKKKENARRREYRQKQKGEEDKAPVKTELDEWYEKRFDYRERPSSEPVNPWIRK